MCSTLYPHHGESHHCEGMYLSGSPARPLPWGPLTVQIHIMWFDDYESDLTAMP